MAPARSAARPVAVKRLRSRSIVGSLRCSLRRGFLGRLGSKDRISELRSMQEPSRNPGPKHVPRLRHPFLSFLGARLRALEKLRPGLLTAIEKLPFLVLEDFFVRGQILR